MRLFIATFLDTRLISSNFNAFKDEADNYVKGKWVENENLHFTYHFMGSVNEEVFPELKHRISPFLLHYEEKLNIHSLRITPNINNPKVLVTNIFNPSKKIFTIQKDIKKILKDLKIPFEQRKFKPHMTLVRIKETNDGFMDFIRKNQDYSFGYLKGFDLKLVQSTLTNEKPIYTVV